MSTADTHIPPCAPLQKVQDFVDGNGKLGAKTRLSLLENDMCEMKAALNKATGWIVGAAITLITGGILWIFITLIPAVLKIL